MKNILGLDLGTNSIGWAVIEVNEQTNNPTQIVGIGSRIVPISPNDSNEFSTGNAISKNSDRTHNRTQRKTYDRYQQRRSNLKKILSERNMLPGKELMSLPLIKLWQLRADAAVEGEQKSLTEIGRILLLLNQKRGYRHSKSDDTDTKQKEYVATINERFSILKKEDKTIGQFFYFKLKENEKISPNGKKYYTYRAKDKVFPRQAYIDEFDKIMSTQKVFYPKILTDEFINTVKNRIIYFQRELKSCKHLVSLCELEKKEYKNSAGKIVFDGPKVAPKSSPLFQVCKIWEEINALTLKNRYGQILDIPIEKKRELFHFLDNNEKLTLKDLYRILEIKKSDGWWGGKAIGKGLQGNITKILLKKALSDSEELLTFNYHIIDSNLVDTATGEIFKEVCNDYQKESLYQLWHVVYSISDKNEFERTIKKHFQIEDEDVIDKLYHIDFTKLGYGNKSVKAIRKILPYLEDGMFYSSACQSAGYNPKKTITLAEKLPLIQKNELRQPVVEKILNQMINVVNAIINKYGNIDEVRIELARELKQSREERKDTDINMRLRERQNAHIAQIIEESGMQSSKNRILKYRLWEESGHKCFYCGQPVKCNEFLNGFDVETEHIIPKGLLFDDSFSNKVCSCRECNQSKGMTTAYDFMSRKPEFEEYISRVEQYYLDKKISKTKHDKLLMSQSSIPNDFIDRQLRQTQYIARKSQEILAQVCHNVYATSGSVTDYIRRVWGYDNILTMINLERYRKSSLTTFVEYTHNNQIHNEERIEKWSKRMDHRHHAIDALIIACTKQSIIQRLNNLNANRDAKFVESEKQSDEWKIKNISLEKWLALQSHFSTSTVKDAIEQIIPSFKSGKRVAVLGKRFKYHANKRITLQKNIIIPRGALSDQFVYGRIKVIEKCKPIKYFFENSDLIFKSYIKELVKQRITECNNNIKDAMASLKERPIYLDKNEEEKLQYATCWRQEYVIKYPVNSLKSKDINSIVDIHLREIIQKRLSDFGNNEKEAFKDTIYYDTNKTIPIHTIRCFTGLSAVKPLQYDENKKAIGFVKPGNNHHIAIYIDQNGVRHEHLVTFWHAVDRKRYDIPVIITKPIEVWNKLQEGNYPESFLKEIPDIRWKYEMSIQQNEMFILGMPEDAFNDAIHNNDYITLNKYLYRVQNISESTYRFTLNTCTQFDLKSANKPDERFYNIQSLKALYAMNPYKVKVSLLGEIQYNKCNER